MKKQRIIRAPANMPNYTSAASRLGAKRMCTKLNQIWTTHSFEYEAVDGGLSYTINGIAKLPKPIVEKSTIKLSGSCSLCSRGSHANGVTEFPYSTVYKISSAGGGGLELRVCEDCMGTIKAAK